MTAFIGFEVVVAIVGTLICYKNINKPETIGRLIGLYVAIGVPLLCVEVYLIVESVISLLKGTGVI